MRPFALERISNLEINNAKFTHQALFKARDHRGGGFGTWSYAETHRSKHEVQIRLEGYAARIVA